MSYSYNKRKKLKRKFKNQYGKVDGWIKFRQAVEQMVREKQGSPIGNLQDIIDLKKETI